MGEPLKTAKRLNGDANAVRDFVLPTEVGAGTVAAPCRRAVADAAKPGRDLYRQRFLQLTWKKSQVQQPGNSADRTEEVSSIKTGNFLYDKLACKTIDTCAGSYKY